MTKPIAVQLYTVREALAQDWEGTLERIAEMGYIGVETAGFGYAPSRAAAIDKYNTLGLQVCGAHGPLLTRENESELVDMMNGGALNVTFASLWIGSNQRVEIPGLELVRIPGERFEVAHAV